jgi:hypothetical protein
LTQTDTVSTNLKDRESYAWKLRGLKIQQAKLVAAALTIKELLSQLPVSYELQGIVESRLDEACLTLGKFVAQFERRLRLEHKIE